MGYNCAAPRKQPQLGLLLIDFQVEISLGEVPELAEWA